MKYKPSIAFDAMSGSAKGVTATRNRSVTYLRTKVMNNRSKTQAQANVKAIFKQISQIWKTLSPFQIANWNTAAQSQEGRRVLGQTARLTGANLFTRLNYWVVRCGGNILMDVPQLSGIESPSLATLIVSDDSIRFQLSSAPQQSGLQLVIMACKPQSKGVVTGVGKGAAIIEPTPADGSAMNLRPAYVDKYGAPTASRPKVFLRYFLVNPITGEKSLDQTISAVLGYGPAVQYTLNATSANPAQGTVTPSGPRQYDEGTIVQLTATPAHNYAFSRWSDGNTINPRSIVIDQDINIQAEFISDIHYTISTIATPSVGGSISGGGSYPEGATVTLQATPSYGRYTFKEWADDPTAPATRQVIADADKTYTAIFEQIRSRYNLNIGRNLASLGTISDYEDGEYVFDTGTVIELTAIPTSESHFDRWSDGDTSNPRTIVMNRDYNLQAIFISEYEAGIICTANFDEAGRFTGDEYYHVGETAIVTAIPNRDWEFVRWADNGSTNPVRQVLVDQYDNIELTAIFQSEYCYEVRGVAEPEEGGEVTGGGEEFHKYDVATLTAVPADGYHFTQWEDDPSAGATRQITVRRSDTYYALFEPDDEE